MLGTNMEITDVLGKQGHCRLCDSKQSFDKSADSLQFIWICDQ
jgi:hypothetical protein